MLLYHLSLEFEKASPYKDYPIPLTSNDASLFFPLEKELFFPGHDPFLASGKADSWKFNFGSLSVKVPSGACEAVFLINDTASSEVKLWKLHIFPPSRRILKTILAKEVRMHGKGGSATSSEGNMQLKEGSVDFGKWKIAVRRLWEKNRIEVAVNSIPLSSQIFVEWEKGTGTVSLKANVSVPIIVSRIPTVGGKESAYFTYSLIPFGEKFLIPVPFFFSDTYKGEILHRNMWSFFFIEGEEIPLFLEFIGGKKKKFELMEPRGRIYLLVLFEIPSSFFSKVVTERRIEKIASMLGIKDRSLLPRFPSLVGRKVAIEIKEVKEEELVLFLERCVETFTEYPVFVCDSKGRVFVFREVETKTSASFFSPIVNFSVIEDGKERRILSSGDVLAVLGKRKSGWLKRYGRIYNFSLPERIEEEVEEMPVGAEKRIPL